MKYSDKTLLPDKILVSNFIHLFSVKNFMYHLNFIIWDFLFDPFLGTSNLHVYAVIMCEVSTLSRRFNPDVQLKLCFRNEYFLNYLSKW